MVQQIGQDELVAAFSQSVGIEKARDIVETAAETAGIEPKESYNTQEVVRICDTIQTQNESNFITIVANEFKIRKRADKRFYALFENIPDPAAILEFEGAQAVLRAVNDEFEETFGFEQAEVTGEQLADFIVPEEQRKEAQEINSLLLSGQAVEREVQRQTADGQLRDFLFRATSVQKETGAIESYGIYTDITERKRRRRKLEQRNEMLEEFSTVVTHDLRNPLAIAQSHLSFALEDLQEEYEGYEFLSDVDEALERMDSLIEDLLALAKHGQRIEEQVAVGLDDVARDAWDSVETADARLVVDSGTDIEADRSRLVQLLENLFRNSIEHGFENGASGPDSQFTVRVGMLADGNGFYVGDSGRGIDDEKKEKVLEYGYTTDQGGTGLGLSIVTSIAEAHDWDVSVCDSDAGGACFELSGVTVLAGGSPEDERVQEEAGQSSSS